MTDADFDIGVGPFTRLCIVVQAVFIVARCTGMVDWPWAVVFAPLMLWLLVWLIAFVAGVVLMAWVMHGGKRW